MMNMIRNVIVAVLGLFILASCSKDDDSVEITPPRDRGEVEVESQANLKAYLNTHFYNYEEFEAKEDGFNYKIVFDTISGVNSDKTPLMSQVITEKFTYLDTEYTLYTLIAREGAGIQPTFADSTFVNYQGNVVGGDKFDSSVTPLWFDLTQVVFGFSNGLKNLKAGTQFSQNADGSVSFGNDYGIGAVFIPSGLAYFNGSGTGYSAYSDLVFTFDLYRAVEDTDDDNDGVPNWKEDINGNNFLNEIEDDSDGDNIPDYLDTDDDGDRTLTRDEIVINADGTITYTDSNNDGIPDYLDPDVN
ncbi:FKBP-type peptidyl-prolyl cis-trans isomerase [Leeuwenhoekiella sp. MAR_2009_132]|uniref:FKBP-type peptidyl-prolyl cis-trans isomerase n=1 Tax=Leeuwenhoekiella sp. MAR_2009_132 TaxID=1392489 RepID=UPI000A900CB4|nr:FKBP-type peptidyl-prolyl cis-trans isomerase [Leeuwenhoekiella sp. MAR_2009_132]